MRRGTSGASSARIRGRDTDSKARYVSRGLSSERFLSDLCVEVSHKKFVVLELPGWLGARGHARRICASIPEVACDCLVVVESPHDSVPSTEFCDELVKVVLKERRAVRLVMSDLSPQVASMLRSSALRQGVSDRLDES